MIEVNRKIIFAVLALAVVLLATPYVGTVFAGKGQTSQSFEYFYKEWPLSTDGPDAHASPRGSELVDYRTFHGRDTTHDSPILEYAITIGGNVEDRFIMIWREGRCDYEYNAKTMICIHKATEKMTLSDGTVQGTVILSIIEKIDFASPTMDCEGTFVGFGTGAFEDVKIVSTTSSELVEDEVWSYCLYVTVAGTVMGWPD